LADQRSPYPPWSGPVKIADPLDAILTRVIRNSFPSFQLFLWEMKSLERRRGEVRRV
jgi:hypothetical protein